ncbi:MAG: carbohydrate ABC transporter permease [bacterium]|nr:carbohydrate ABC transporter permease [bacterium]
MKSFTFGTIVRHVFLLCVGLLILVPVIFTLLTSLKYFRDIISGSLAFTPTLDNYKELFLASRNSFTRLTLNSLIIGAGSTCIVVIFGGLASYSFTRYRWSGLWSKLVLGWLLVVHMLPPIIYVGPFYLISRALRIYDSHLAVIMAHVVLNLPLGIFMLYDFFAEIPRELEEAAWIDGASHIQTFWKVALPMIKPGLAATAVLVFIFSWKEFMFALSLTSTEAGMTIPVGIAGFVQEYNVRYGEMSAAAMFASVPALILVIFAQKHIIKGMTLGAVKG